MKSAAEISLSEITTGNILEFIHTHRTEFDVFFLLIDRLHDGKLRDTIHSQKVSEIMSNSKATAAAVQLLWYRTGFERK